VQVPEPFCRTAPRPILFTSIVSEANVLLTWLFYILESGGVQSLESPE
jgi:hypothetical protein